LTVAAHAQSTPVAPAPVVTPPNGDTTAQRQTQAEQTSAPPAPEAPPLSLEACIALAMKKNFDLQIESYSVEQAREALVIARSDFLTTLSGSTSRYLSRSTYSAQGPNGTTILVPGDSNSTSYRATVTERLPQTNGTLSVSGSAARSSLQPVPFSSGVSASISQPLLNGAGSTVARALVERSKLGLSIAQVNYRSRVLLVIRDTENAYYNLVSARETLRIRQLSLELAQRLFEENQARRSTGVATDLVVATAEVGVANARRALLQADQAVRNAEDALLSLINDPHLEARPGPVAFSDFREAAPSFADAYKAARENYPDTLSTQDLIKQLEIDVATAKRNRLPTLNLNASIGYNNLDSSYYDALSNLPDNHGDTRSVSLTYSIPWGMRADRARYRTAVAGLNAEKARLEQLELQLLVSVRSAVRAVETNHASVEIAAQATQLAAKQYDLQKARFDAGLSTSRLVLQAQDDLETARMNELAAKATLWSALAELHRLEGTSLDRFGVKM
jgi:outer membrane protein TolC